MAALPGLLNGKNKPPTLLQNFDRRFDVCSLYIIHSSASPYKQWNGLFTYKLTFWCIRIVTVAKWKQQCVLCVSELHSTVSYIEITIAQQWFYDFLTFCWPCISVYLSQYLTNLMHKICFTIRLISCLYTFRAHVLIIRRSKLHYTASGIITPIGGRHVHGLREQHQHTLVLFSLR